MSAQARLFVNFECCSAAEQGRLARALAKEIDEMQCDAEVDVRRDRPDTMDFGSTLVLVLGTPVVTVLAQGIASFIARHGTQLIISRTELDGSNVQVVARGLRGTDLAKISESLKAAFSLSK